jgi:general secretion pathway protein D
MIKRFLFVLLCFFSISANAQISMQFEEVRLAPLSRLVLSDIAKVPFLLSQEVIEDKTVITLQTDKLKSNMSVQWLRDILYPYGYDIKIRAGLHEVVKVTRPIERGEEVFIYRPKNRSLSYLLDVCKSFIQGGKWSTDRPASAASAIAVPASPRTASESVMSSASVGSTISSKDTDVLIYEGSAQEIARLKKLIAEVDTKPAQVVIQAMLYEVSNIAKDSSALGVAGEILGGRLGINLGSVAGGPWSAFAAVGGVKAVFSALSSDTRFNAVAKPNLRLLSGASGRVSVGDETPILGAVSTSQGGVVTQSIEYRASGHILQVTPVVLDSGVELTINQQSSSFVQTTTGVNQSPTLLKREVSSRVMVDPGSFVVLGGMQETKDTGDVSGPRWFPTWAKKDTKDKSETELLLVLYVEKV